MTTRNNIGAAMLVALLFAVLFGIPLVTLGLQWALVITGGVWLLFGWVLIAIALMLEKK